MRLLRLIALAAAVPLTACAHGVGTRSSRAEASLTERHLAEGVALLEAGRCEEAIHERFEPALAAYRAEHGGPPLRVTRADPSSLDAALDPARRRRATDARAYTDALYLEAVCFVALGNVTAAEHTLAEALAIAPDDVAYLCELGHVYQRTARWAHALTAFDRALESVEALERAMGRAGGGEAHVLGQPLVRWRTRALRGVGFTLVELGELDEAAAVYEQVLRLDPRDAQASAEVRLIDQRRAEASRRENRL